MKNTKFFVILGILFLGSSLFMKAINGDWVSFIHDYNNTRFQPDSLINSLNANQLIPAWNVITQNAVTSTPIVRYGNVYFADWGGYAYSVNILTGSLNWRKNVGQAVSSTPEIYNNLLYIGMGPQIVSSVKPTVTALNIDNGTTVWTTVLNTSMTAIWASPTIYNGVLYIGTSAGEIQGEDNPSTQGAMFAINALNGNVLWRKIMAGNSGGTGVWSTVVVDPILNSIYFGTGNPFANNSNSLFGYSMTSLNASNGNINWYNQVCTQGLNVCGDADFGSTPNLFTINGISVVGLGNKDGNYMIFNRMNGTLLKKFPIGTSENVTNPDGGIIGVAGMTNTTNPEIFIPSFNGDHHGVVEAVYPANNTIGWRFNLNHTIFGSIAVANGIVMFNDENGRIYAVNSLNGNQLFIYKLPNGMDSGVTISANYVLTGTLYGSSTTLGVYAFTLPNPISTTTTISSTTTLTTSTSLLTTTIPSCSGTLALRLSPNPAIPNTVVTASVNGLTSCNGTTVNIKTYEGCSTGVIVTSCVYGSAGCSAVFVDPPMTGNFGYWACGDGQAVKQRLTVVNSVSTTSITTSTTATSTTSSASSSVTSTATSTSSIASSMSSSTTSATSSVASTSATTTISSCSGTLGMKLMPNPAVRGSSVNANVTGLSSCTGNTVLIKTYEGCASGFTVASCVYGSFGCISSSWQAPGAAGQWGYWGCVGGKAIKQTLVTT